MPPVTLQIPVKTSVWTKVALSMILVAGLGLRLYGIHWGLPDISHQTYSYNPDEALHVFMADWLSTGNILPKHFMYGGTLYFAILNACAFVAERLESVLAGPNLLADVILFGRYLFVVAALLTVVLLYRTARLLYDRATALLAALFLAVVPAHIVWAQWLRPDELAALAALLVFYLAVRIYHDEKPSLRNYAYVGLVLGAATALRFPLLVFASGPIAAALLTSPPLRLTRRLLVLFDRRISIMAGCVVVGYAIASPQTFMYPRVFLAGLKVQWLYQTQPFPDAVGMGPGIYQYGWLMLHQALGYALYALVALGLFFALVRRAAADWLLLAAIVPYLVLTSFTSWVMVRYTLPVVPLLLILAARVMAEWLRMAFVRRASGAIVLALAVVWTLLGDVAYLRLEAGPDIRDVASRWIGDHVPRGSSLIAVKTYVEDYYFNPVIPKGYDYYAYYLVDSVDGAQLFRNGKYDYLILNEYIYKNMERLGGGHPSRAAREFSAALQKSRYHLIKEFKHPVECLGIVFSGSFSSNDYTIINPGIRIYQRETS